MGALEFHHKDPSLKEFGPSGRILKRLSWEKITKEIDKCILLCANCHRELHDRTKEKLSKQAS
jgi:predicted HNH restriction endonuclease